MDLIGGDYFSPMVRTGGEPHRSRKRSLGWRCMVGEWLGDTCRYAAVHLDALVTGPKSVMQCPVLARLSSRPVRAK